MTSDLNNKDFEEVDFPVNFNETDESLDVFGVFIKKAPTDFIEESIRLEKNDDFNDFDDLLAELNGFDSSDNITDSTINETSTMDFELDDFINDFNETGEVQKDETLAQLDEIEPLNIELEFDESFIEETMEAREKGTFGFDTDTIDSDFGVELIDETITEFDTFTEGSFVPPTATENEQVEEVLDQAINGTIEITNEFDDFLSDLESKSSPKDQKETQLEEEPAHTFNLSVSEEDESNLSNSSQTIEIQSDSDINVSIWDKKTEIIKPSSNVETQEQEITIEDEENNDFLEFHKETDYNIEGGSNATLVEDNTPLEDKKMSLEFDDIDALEQELNETFSNQNTSETINKNEAESTEILLKIAKELDVIKNEISELKNELSCIKKTNDSFNTGSINLINNESESSGFFSDQDSDEAIALTGDELNNILITADFTEEKIIDDLVMSETDDLVMPETDDLVMPETDDLVMSETDDLVMPETDDLVMSETDDLVMSETDDLVMSETDDLVMSETDDLVMPEADDLVMPEADDPNSILDITIEESDQENDFIPIELTEEFINEGNSPFDQNIKIQPITSLEEDTSYLDGIENEVETDDTSILDILDNEIEDLDFENEDLEEPTFDDLEIDLDALENDFPTEQEIPVPTSIDNVHNINQNDFLEDENQDNETQKKNELVEQEKDTDNLHNNTELIGVNAISKDLKEEIKSVLSYMDQLLENLPESKIEEFAKSEQYEVYKKLFDELGIS